MGQRVAPLDLLRCNGHDPPDLDTPLGDVSNHARISFRDRRTGSAGTHDGAAQASLVNALKNHGLAPSAGASLGAGLIWRGQVPILCVRSCA